MKKSSHVRLLLTAVFVMIGFLSMSYRPAQAAKKSPVSVYTEGTSKNHSVDLIWTREKNASFYIVERSTKVKDSWGEYIRINASVRKNSYTDKTTKKNKSYQYRVYAVKDNKEQLIGEVKVTVKKPKALILDCSGRRDAGRVRDYLKHSGFSVKVVKDNVYVNSRKDIMLDDYDALVIPGGNSVNPVFYHDKVHNSHSHFGKKANDRIQIDAVRKFKNAKKPVLGICRGCQLVNVALGGTLIQCIGKPHTHLGGVNRKVTIKKDTWLYNRFGASLKTVHSHHQNVKKLGEGLYATQWDRKDGNVEAYEHESLPIFGLQWHPDKWKGKDGRKRSYSTGLAVFKEFRSVCQQWMSKD